jgi:hypothetical protein
LLPKPEGPIHREALLRCLIAGLRRTDEPVANAIEASPDSFAIVAWTYDFYGRHQDIGDDRAGIDAVIEQQAASAADLNDATSWSRRAMRWIYLLADQLPFSMEHLVGQRIASHLRDVRRYNTNKDGVADEVRRKLKRLILDANRNQRPILLIGHSMGSIIAYDTLWELSHDASGDAEIDTLLTIGSPLGQRFMQRRFKGSNKTTTERYPSNIHHWTNIAAVGDMTALDRHIADDFGEMLALGLIEDIVDLEIVSYFRSGGKLNTHSEYGYLVNEKTARTVAAWWSGCG